MHATSPPLRPVTAAFAHLLTDQHPIWSVLRVIYVSCNYGFITCLAQTLVLPEICLLQAQDACRNIITICTPMQTNRGCSFCCYNFCCPTNAAAQGRNYCFSSALLAFKGRIAHLMANPWTFKSLGRCARHAQIYSSCGALAPHLANAPFVETRFSFPKQYSRNSIPLPFPIFQQFPNASF